MSLTTGVVGGTATIDQNKMKEIRDAIISKLTSLDGQIKVINEDGTSVMENKKPFENCNTSPAKDSLNITLNGDEIAIIEAMVQVISEMVCKKVIEQMALVAKKRIDNYSTEFDTMITSLDAFAAAMSAITIPVNGTAVGAAMTVATTLMKVPQLQRNMVFIPEESSKATDFE